MDVSIGYAFTEADMDWMELCKQADLMMYEVKRYKKTGRDYQLDE